MLHSPAMASDDIWGRRVDSWADTQKAMLSDSDGMEAGCSRNPLEERSANTPSLLSSADGCSYSICTRCEEPIRDRFVTKVQDNLFHNDCLRCSSCNEKLMETCFIKNDSLFCRLHYIRKFAAVKCGFCKEGIAPESLIQKVNEHVYHNECFKCVICKKNMEPGDEFFLIPMDGRVVCKGDYELAKNKTPDAEMESTNKRPRTTISAKSLETLKQAYQNSSKPARHVREQLAAETGLDMRVVQVWFQNRRAKEKRLKKDAGRRWGVGGAPKTDSDSNSPSESVNGQSPGYGFTDTPVPEHDPHDSAFPEFQILGQPRTNSALPDPSALYLDLENFHPMHQSLGTDNTTLPPSGALLGLDQSSTPMTSEHLIYPMASAMDPNLSNISHFLP